MEDLLKKISESGLDASSILGEEAIIFWNHILQHIATTAQEKAMCLVISAEYRRRLKQPKSCIEELRLAIEHLILPNDSDLILEIKHCLAERLVENSEYSAALQEYISCSTIAVDNSHIDAYVLAVVGMGNLCGTYGDHARALRYYQKIDAIDHAISSRSLRLKYKLYILACYIELNRTAAAKDTLKECSELAILVSDKTFMSQILLYQAKLYRKQNKYNQAMECLGNIQYTAGNMNSMWLSKMVRFELAHCLNNTKKPHLANWVLDSAQKKMTLYASPILDLKFNTVLGELYEQQEKFKQALECQKRAFRIESDLMKQVPIAELGASQLRRLARFELHLKLILSEIENRELKETTENQKNTVAKLKQDVFTDPLTNLNNRRWLDVKLKDLLLHDVPFALLIVDIDHFKSINDELSHLVGDKAIVNVSSELATYFKFRGASCVRFGGEEFLVIIERCTIEQASMHAENYRERIFQYGWQAILGERGLSVSIGITLHLEGENTQRTFHRADKALYRAKANGRNQVCTE
ncbi:GGDEF domain-containing protein [Vibrio hepatarius]|uniref:GGDEF domain-containing protein n=1 Tax=Vibrio hepatarius TaxID=171383 RepID=UPI001C08E019|nr:GGDEF domain-containing protein [Vibrio hepatarius]MBU2895843.1 GGDEF domain-containing protein [Vibrio hepatarius]